MGQPLETRIRRLQDHYWSAADPEGRAFVSLADAFRRAGDFREAGRILRDGLKRHPSLSSGHLVAAWTALDQGHVEAAEDAFGKVLAIDPRNVAALRGLGEIRLERRELASALELFERLLQEDPLDGELPVRVQALRETIRAVDRTDLPAELEAGPPPSTLWDDPDRVAEELDWEAAALQEDHSEEEEAGGGSERSDEDEAALPRASDAGEGPPSPTVDLREDTLVTPTLGEIYFRQGLLDWAEGVFEVLVDRDPDNASLRARLEEIRARRRGGGEVAEESPEAVGVRAESPTPDEAVPIEAPGPDMALPIEAPGPDTALPIEALAPDTVVSIEFLAPDMALPIEAPGPDTALPIEALAPDTVVSIEFLAPDTVLPIEALAPDTVLPIEALGPDTVVPIEALAPDTVVPIEALAPDTVVPIEFLAPSSFRDRAPDLDRGDVPVDRPQ